MIDERKGFKILRRALAEIECLCGAPGSERMKQCQNIYDIARVALERVGVPGSPDYASSDSHKPNTSAGLRSSPADIRRRDDNDD